MLRWLAALAAVVCLVAACPGQPPPTQFLSKGDGKVYPHGRAGDPLTPYPGWSGFVPIAASMDGKWLLTGVTWDNQVLRLWPVTQVTPTVKVGPYVRDVNLGGAVGYRRPFSLFSDRASWYFAQQPDTRPDSDPAKDRTSVLMKFNLLTLAKEGEHVENHPNGISFSASDPCPQFGTAAGPEDGRPIFLRADPGLDIDLPRLVREFAAYAESHGVRLRVHDHRPVDKRTGRFIPPGYVGTVSLAKSAGDPLGSGSADNPLTEWLDGHRPFLERNTWLPCEEGPAGHPQVLHYALHEGLGHFCGNNPDEYSGTQFARANPHMWGSPGNLMGNMFTRADGTRDYANSMKLRPDQVEKCRKVNATWMARRFGGEVPEAAAAARNVDPVVRQLVRPQEKLDFVCGTNDWRRVYVVAEDPFLPRDEARWVQQTACDRLRSWGVEMKWYDHRPAKTKPRYPGGMLSWNMCGTVRVAQSKFWWDDARPFINDLKWTEITANAERTVWVRGRHAGRPKEAVADDVVRGVCEALGVAGIDPANPTGAHKAAVRSAVADRWMGRDKAPEWIDSQLY